MRTKILAVLLLAGASLPIAQARVNPRLKDVRKIYVHALNTALSKNGKMTVGGFGSSDEVKESLISAIATSGRFAAVQSEKDADARVEGAAGYVKSEKDGKKYTTGYALLKLIDVKSKEILWTFEYHPKSGTGGKAADRVANQFIEALLADAKEADGS